MNRQKVDSSMIASVGYDAQTKTLELEFKSRKDGVPGKVYAYEGVSKGEYDSLMSAKSLGTHFGKYFRAKGYTFREIKPEGQNASQSQE